MADPQHIKVLERGPDAWNTWRERHPTTRPDLSDADLSGADLSGADLSDADLSSADLSSAHLSGAHLNGADLIIADLSGANLSSVHLIFANLSGANLSGANLSGADLSSADLSSADLSDADLSSAHLIFAHLSGANLSGADLSKAEVDWTCFDRIDLSTVKGLEAVVHDGPSTIGIDTIYRSKGYIPEAFLREAGVPEDFIIYMRSLVAHPRDYYTCFISYSSRDQDFAERLHANLQSEGVRCWFAPEDLRIGEKFWHRIDESIRQYDKLLVVLSEHSVNSEWVEREVMAALEKEQQQNKPVLFPITLDTLVKQTNLPWAADIRRTRHIGDFSRWKDHHAYQQAFKRLLRDLQANEKPRAENA